MQMGQSLYDMFKGSGSGGSGSGSSNSSQPMPSYSQTAPIYTQQGNPGAGVPGYYNY
jgi:hypothetical protein